VNFVAVTEDERGHLGVPEAGLVTKVDTGFKHFAHGNGHKNTPKVGSKIQSTHRAQPKRQHATPCRDGFADELCLRVKTLIWLHDDHDTQKTAVALCKALGL
jgi:hypothetical protein